MQATLLGLGTLIILALLAALVGPHFVDFNQYRAQFESEASRLTGMPLHVEGPIDVRLLPTPSLVLHQVEAGRQADAGRVRVRKLSIELALGPLLRGEWQAAEARIVGPELRVALDQSGHLVWPISPAGLNPAQFSVRRLIIEDGRAVLDDAASVSRVVLEKFAFAGEVRSFLGPVKGDGSFAVDGQSYGFSVSLGRFEPDGAAKLRVSLSPNEPPLAMEADGTLRLASGTPEFDGSINLSRPAGAASSTGHGVALVPWHATGQIKATPSSALIQNLEYQYGPDERSFKLTGNTSLKFGKTPRFDAALAARQLDVDGLLALQEPARQPPLAVAHRLVESLAGQLKTPLPGKVGISIDAVTLAGSLLQDIRADIAFDAKGWDLQSVELRAPGLTRVRGSGRLAADGDALSFKGPAEIEAADLKSLVSWLEARPVSAESWQGALRAKGEFTLSSDRVAVDQLRAEIDDKNIEGRLDYRLGSDRAPARLSGELRAAQLNIDEAKSFAEAALAGSKAEIPGEVALTLDIGVAAFAGLEARNVRAKFTFDQNGLMLEGLAVGDLGGAALNANGRIEQLKSSPRGAVNLEIDARALDGVVELIAKVSPRLAELIGSAGARLVPLKAKAGLTLAGAAGGLEGTTSKLEVQGSAGRVRLQLAAEAAGKPWDQALPIKLTAQAASDEASALLGALGLDRFIGTEKGPATLTVSAQGPLNGELQTNARLIAAGLLLRAEGTAQLSAEAPRLGAELAAQVPDLGAGLRMLGVPSAAKLPGTLTARLEASPSKVQLDGLAGTVAAVPVHGRLTLNLVPALSVDGRLAADTAAGAAIFASLIGLPLAAKSSMALATAGLSSEPFAPSALAKIDGHIDFELGQFQLTPALLARNPRGTLRFGDGRVGFENVQADIAGGTVRVDVGFGQTPEGLNSKGKLGLSNVEVAALLPGSERSVVSGRMSLQAEVQGVGRSPAALVGSLSGIGTLTLSSAHLARLDPKVFETATRAVDQGLAIEPGKIRDVVAPALDKGELSIARAEGPLTVTSGQVRVINLVAQGDGIDLAITGALDLSAGSVDARLTMTGPASGGNPRPDLFITLSGPVAAASRSIDASALANWLMLRSLDREANRTDAAELDRRDPASPAEQRSPPAGQNGSLRRKPLPPESTPLDGRAAPGLDRAPTRPRRAAGDGATQAPPAVPPGAANPSILDRLFGSQR